MAFLNVNDVNFQYPNTTAASVTNLNFELAACSMNVLIGPSGIGKSTLLKLIAGYTQPNQGTLTMAGDLIAGPSWQRGIVFQDMALYPWLSVADNILFGPKMRGELNEDTKQALTQLLEETGLTAYRDKMIYELSGGLQQRVALARAFINRPPLLMLDESFSALDNYTRSEMHQLLLRLWQESENCMLIITHDIDEAMFLGQNVLVMNGTPGTIVSQSPNPYFRRNMAELFQDSDYLAYRDHLLELIES